MSSWSMSGCALGLLLICTAFWTEGQLKSEDYKDTGNHARQIKEPECTEDLYPLCSLWIFLGWAILIPFVLFRLCERMFPINPGKIIVPAARY